MRLFAACDRHTPDGRIVTFLLLINRYAHKGHVRSIRRNLRVSNPYEIEQIFFGDVALLPKYAADACNEKEKNDEWRMSNDEGMTKPEARNI